MEPAAHQQHGSSTGFTPSPAAGYGPGMRMETRPRRASSAGKGDSDSPAFPAMHINLGVVDGSKTMTGVRSRATSDSLFGSEGHTPTCGSSSPDTTTHSQTSSDVSRKQRHNLREQRRIMRIGSQFDHLKAKLEAVGFISNKKDKHSILQATIEYIAALECEAANTRPPSTSTSAPSLELHGQSQPANAGKENAALNQFAPRAVPALDPMHVLHQPPYQPAAPAPSSSIEYLWSLPAPSMPVPELVADSTASFRHVFLHTSVPSLIARLDGTLVHANYLFHEYFPTMADEYMHTLYALCVAADVPKMQSLVNKLLTGDVHSAQTKMTWQAGSTGHVKPVFVSVALVRDQSGHPVNIQCTVLPMA